MCDQVNELVHELFVEVRKTANILKEDPNANIDSVLKIVDKITTVQQLGYYTGSKPLSEHFASSQSVRYLPVGEEGGLWTCGCFAIPPNGIIPLHDHPGMTGVIRVLEGSIDIESFDKCEENSYLARSRGTRKFNSPSTVCLGPQDANIHQIKAGETGAVFLDCLMPDYDDDNGRSCNFYMVDNDPTSSPSQPEDSSSASVDQGNNQESSTRSSSSGGGGAIGKEASGKETSSLVDTRGAERLAQYQEDGLVKLKHGVDDEVNIFTSQWPHDNNEVEIDMMEPPHPTEMQVAGFMLPQPQDERGLDILSALLEEQSMISPPDPPPSCF
jgi:hypothetical protein